MKYSYTIQIEESVRARCSSLNACANNRLETNKDDNGGNLPSGFEMVDGDDGVECEPLTNAWVPDDGVINCMVCMTTKFGGLKRKVRTRARARVRVSVRLRARARVRVRVRDEGEGEGEGEG